MTIRMYKNMTSGGRHVEDGSRGSGYHTESKGFFGRKGWNCLQCGYRLVLDEDNVSLAKGLLRSATSNMGQRGRQWTALSTYNITSKCGQLCSTAKGNSTEVEACHSSMVF